MKIKNLFEKTDVHMPSGDWEHKNVRFFNNPRWTEDAYNQFKDESFVKRLEKVFDRLPFDVVIMPVNEKGSFNIQEFEIHKGFRTKLPLVPSIARFFIDFVSHESISKVNLKKLNKQVAKFISSKIKKDNMVLLISSNFQTEDNTLVTPWSIAHGISHAVESSDVVNPEKIDQHMYNAVRKMCAMTCKAYGIKWTDKLSGSFYSNYAKSRMNTELLPPEYITPYFTFKSARDNDFIHSGEFFNEAFSQFLITGKFTMNTNLPNELYGNKLIDPNAVDQKFILKLEKELNTEFTNIIDRLKGKVVLTYDE